MSKKRQVRGLLDYIEAKGSGEEWEFAKPSPDWVPGIGIGATPEATRWAYSGWLSEQSVALPRRPKRGKGQPTKNPKVTNDAKRAFLLYLMARKIREANGADPTFAVETRLFELIDLAKDSLPTKGLFEKPKAPNKMYESVKRGRELLGIDEYWRSSELESLFNSD